MNIKEIYKKLDKYQLEKYLSYNTIPILYFEAMCDGYINNPLLNKLNVKKYPTKIINVDKTLEGWQNINKWVIFKDKKIIRKIINKNQNFIKKQKIIFVKIKNKKKFTNEELIKSLKKINKLVVNLYNYFVFFPDECFVTDNKDLINVLSKVRWEISLFVEEDIWPTYDVILNNISKNLNSPIEIVNRSTTNELLSVLNNKKTFKELGVSKSRSFGIIVIEDNLYKIFGKQVKELKKYLNKKDVFKKNINEVKQIKEIKGMPAQKGVIKGNVLKLLEKDYPNAKKVFKNKKDYILVTPMTRPEIVQYIKRSLAIITDEGGITCHASIIAREMNKPCIIGTKIATKVLKDGDLVKVDANKGIVKILKRKNA